MYKLCPKCEINYIQDGENLCRVCGAQEHSYSKKLVRGRCYGTNSHNIYLDLCRAYDWDEKKAWSFGQKKRLLYAKNVDKGHSLDVWFIPYAIDNKNKSSTVVDTNNFVNFIQDGGEIIIEVCNGSYCKTSYNNQIVFLKTDGEYEFLGIYSLIENGDYRKYRRICDCFPDDD